MLYLTQYLYDPGILQALQTLENVFLKSNLPSKQNEIGQCTHGWPGCLSDD